MDRRRGTTENLLRSPVTKVLWIRPLSTSAFVLRLPVEFGPKTAQAMGALPVSSSQGASQNVVQLQLGSICQGAVCRQPTHGIPGLHEGRGVAPISGRFTLGTQEPPVSK